jgi:protein-L-isoaspartate(D-aspartate) O-methyltransferase
MKARKHLRETRMSNIKLKHADGTMGLPDFGPFDGIIVTAAASHIPEDLMQQLAIGGRMVIPVGVEEQVLHMIERTESDGGTEFIKTKLEPVKFVPLLGGTN